VGFKHSSLIFIFFFKGNFNLEIERAVIMKDEMTKDHRKTFPAILLQKHPASLKHHKTGFIQINSGMVKSSHCFNMIIDLRPKIKVGKTISIF